MVAVTDDETIERVVRRAYLPPLLAALAQATGDLSLLREDLRPDPKRPRDPQGGMTTEQRIILFPRQNNSFASDHTMTDDLRKARTAHAAPREFLRHAPMVDGPTVPHVWIPTMGSWWR